MTLGSIDADQTIIRLATFDDLPAIVGLLADDELGFQREQASPVLDPRYVQAYAEMCAQGGNELFVVEGAGCVIACMQFTVIPGVSRSGAKRAQIEGVRVASAHRHEGIGLQLINYAIERARNVGCALVQLTTDKTRPGVQEFYEKLGFEPSHIGMKITL